MRTRDNSRKKSITTQGFFALLVCCAMGIVSITGSSSAQTNTSLGALALSSSPTGTDNSAVGYQALRYNTTGFSNSAFGSTALISNIGGNSNSAFGFSALASNTSGDVNSAFGYGALHRNETGQENSAFGYKALYNNTANSNSAFGYEALWNNITGQNNSAFGHGALSNNTAGSNSAFGHSALYKNTTGQENASVGYNALNENTTGSQNTAVGSNSLELNTTGGHNTAVGYKSLSANTTANDNSAFGYHAMRDNTTGISNSAMGYSALRNNTTGQSNAAFGTNASRHNQTGRWNSAFGNSSLLMNTSGQENTALGTEALRNNTTGGNNAAVGRHALASNTTGAYHVAVGAYAGPNTGNLQNTVTIGYNVVASSSNSVRIGNENMLSIGGWTQWSDFSDARIKNNVQANVPGIDFIKKLRPVTYTYDLDAYDKLVGVSARGKADAAARAAKEHIVYTGFIAQEVEQAAKELQYDFSGVDKPGNENTPYSLRYAAFVVPVVKATQEQQVIIEAQQKQLAVQEGEITTLKERLAKLEHLLLKNTTDVEPTDGASESSFIVYPNPSDGMVRIALQGNSTFPAELQVYDATGKLVLSKTVSSGVGETSFDLSGKVAGSYIVTLVQGQQKVSKVVTVSGK